MRKKRGKITHNPSLTSTAHTQPVTVTIVCVLVVGLGLWMMMWKTSKLPVPAKIVNQLNRLAFQGKLNEVKQLVEENSDLDWTVLGNQRGGLTAIHHALHGRQNSLTVYSGPLVGKHEVCSAP